VTDAVNRPAWLDYWNLQPRGPGFPEFNPNWRVSDHQHGVGFYAPWEEVYAGFPEHARRCALALAGTGIPVHLRSVQGGSQFVTTKDIDAARAFEAMKKALEPLLMASIKNYDVDVYQVVAEDSSFHRLAGPTHPYLDDKQLRYIYGRRIISSVFERDRVSASVVECLNRVGQVWVGNTGDKAMLERCGVRAAIHVVPVPYFPSDPHLALNGRKRLPGRPRFYHVGKWEPRKEHRNIIGAFLLAFGPGEAQLFLKTSAKGPKLTSGYPESPTEAGHQWLEDERVQAKGWTRENYNADVYIIQQRLSPGRLLQLHRQCDVYVTLSRGEGFDMPSFDAKLAGNLMIYTPSGGPQDFAGKLDELVEKTGDVPCDPFYGWGDEARYLDYSLDDAVAAFKRAGQRVRGVDLEERFSAAAVGKTMRDCIEQLKRDNDAVVTLPPPAMDTWSLGEPVFKWLMENLCEGATIVELGSGAGSEHLARRWGVFSVEHDQKYVGKYPGPEYIHAPIVKGWYDTERLRGALPESYDMIIVDGPPGKIGREKFVDHLELFDTSVTMLFDDTQRPAERALVEAVSARVGRPYTQLESSHGRKFAVIEGA
jgi:hypothetical protein